MGGLLIKREGLGESIPLVVGSPGIAELSAVQKIEQVWTGFWQRTGQLDYLVQKLGVCPGTWKPENLSVFAKLSSGLKAENTAADLPHRLGA